MSASAVTTHVLDTARGRPAAGVPVRLSRLDADVSTVVGAGETDDDGRCAGLAAPELEPGTYRLHFDTAAYFERTGQDGFFPEVSITFLLARRRPLPRAAAAVSRSPTPPTAGADHGPSSWEPNQYGKAESRVVRIYRDTARHEIRDVNVSPRCAGDFADAHLAGDQSKVLPTDSQKNTAFAYAKEKGIGEVEDYALTPGPALRRRRRRACPGRAGRGRGVAWERIPRRRRGGTTTRGSARGQEVRTTVVTVEGAGDEQQAWVVSGLKDLTVLKSTGSEFHGFLKDEYTTLPETHDRVMATSLVARWRFGRLDVDWGKTYDDVRATLLRTFATVHSPSPCSRRCGRWARPCSRPIRRSRRSGSRRPTSTTSWSTSSRSAWTTPARCSSPPTVPTA